MSHLGPNPARMHLPRPPRLTEPLTPNERAMLRWIEQLLPALSQHGQAFDRFLYAAVDNVGDGQVVKRTGNTLVGTGPATTFTLTNHVNDFAIDEAATTLAEVANVLGTLIKRLGLG